MLTFPPPEILHISDEALSSGQERIHTLSFSDEAMLKCTEQIKPSSKSETRTSPKLYWSLVNTPGSLIDWFVCPG